LVTLDGALYLYLHTRLPFFAVPDADPKEPLTGDMPGDLPTRVPVFPPPFLCPRRFPSSIALANHFCFFGPTPCAGSPLALIPPSAALTSQSANTAQLHGHRLPCTARDRHLPARCDARSFSLTEPSFFRLHRNQKFHFLFFCGGWFRPEESCAPPMWVGFRFYSVVPGWLFPYGFFLCFFFFFFLLNP